MLTPFELEQRLEQRARILKAEALTPQHAAAEAAMGACDDEEDQAEEAEEVRRRVQHEADPYLHDAPEVAHADLGKRFDQAYDTPAGYPQMGAVSPETFRRGPIVTGEAAYGPGYCPPARRVPVPSATVSAAAIARPLMTGGQSRPCAPEGC